MYQLLWKLQDDNSRRYMQKGVFSGKAEGEWQLRMAAKDMMPGSDFVLTVLPRMKRANTLSSQLSLNQPPWHDNTFVSSAHLLHVCAEPLLLTKTPFGVSQHNTAQGYVVLVLAAGLFCALLGPFVLSS